MSSLNHNIEGNFDDLCKDECLHIVASRHIIEEIDALHDISLKWIILVKLLASCYQKLLQYLLLPDHDYTKAPLDIPWEV